MNRSKKKNKKKRSKYWYFLPLFCLGFLLCIIGTLLAFTTNLDIMYYSLFFIIGMGLLLPKGLYDLVHEPLSPTTARVISILLGLVLGVILYVIALIKKIMN